MSEAHDSFGQPSGTVASSGPAPDYKLSGWWRRAAAIFIDGIILEVVLGIAFSIFGGGWYTSTTTVNNGSGTRSSFLLQYSNHSGIYYLVFAVGSIIYYFLFLTRKGEHNGQTIGKQAMGIRIIRNDGRPVNTETVLLREVLIKGILGTITFGFFLLFDYLWPLGDDENRALHDRWVKTHVVFAHDLSKPKTYSPVSS
jgi:uncharacterized RDD family membrane protein YckC